MQGTKVTLGHSENVMFQTFTHYVDMSACHLGKLMLLTLGMFRRPVWLYFTVSLFQTGDEHPHHG